MSSQHKPFSERRYSESELARILDEASRSEAHGDVGSSPGEGFTLDEVRDIAREAGIDPAHVERAAAGLLASQDAPHPTHRRRSMPFVGQLVRIVHDEVVIPRSLSDDEMFALVHQLEIMVPWSGKFRHAGSWMEWRETEDRLYMGIVRGDGQTRIRLIADQIGLLRLAVAASVIGLSIGGGLDGGVGFVLGLVSALVALGAFWTWRTRAIRSQLREMLESFERSLRSAS